MMVRQQRRGSRKTNAIVYFDDMPDEQGRRHIASIVERVAGVKEAHFNESQQQLMIVDYDPQQTSSGVILSRVRRQRLDAQLV